MKRSDLIIEPLNRSMSSVGFYRFFYHYNKQNKKLTVHYKKKCNLVDNIICSVPTESKWNKTQPNLVMRGFAKKVTIFENTAYIE